MEGGEGQETTEMENMKAFLGRISPDYDGGVFSRFAEASNFD